MSKLKIGIIGCGAMGTFLAVKIARELKTSAQVKFLCDKHAQRALRLKSLLGPEVKILPLAKLLRSSDIIIESASAEIAGVVAREALRLGKKILVMSVGGLLSIKNLEKLRRSSKGALIIPSGAIAGMDALAGAREGRIQSAKLVTRKPPHTLYDAPYFKGRWFPALKGNTPRKIFSGNALQAIRAFPQNINVAAVLSLAGIGPRKTRVEIWTSKSTRKNTHEISVEGNFGKLTTVTENVPSPNNPKTSYLAMLSAFAALRKILK